MKYAFITFALISVLGARGQQVVDLRGNTIEIGVFVDGIDHTKYEGVDGTPYLDPNFVPAKINALEKTQFIRFNIVDQIVEVKIKANKVVMLDLNNDYDIQLLNDSGKKFTTALSTIDGKRLKSYFEVLNEAEKYGLYKQHRKKFLKKQKAEGYQEKLPARFVDQEPAYFVSEGPLKSAPLIALPTKRKKFIALYAKKKGDLARFIKTHKFNLKKEADLIQVLDYVFSATD